MKITIGAREWEHALHVLRQSSRLDWLNDLVRVRLLPTRWKGLNRRRRKQLQIVMRRKHSMIIGSRAGVA